MEWTHTSANLQHAKTTARREQSRESDAPEKHWGLGENGGDAVARQTPPPPVVGDRFVMVTFANLLFPTVPISSTP